MLHGVHQKYFHEMSYVAFFDAGCGWRPVDFHYRPDYLGAKHKVPTHDNVVVSVMERYTRSTSTIPRKYRSGTILPLGVFLS